jgi:methyltransferase
MDKRKLSIAIPSSVISDTPHLREKTSKIGLIGRAAAIFRVDTIIVYQDNPHINQGKDMDFIALLLNYLDAPQYLRKSLFKIEPDLQFAGILPPLRTPNHPLSGKVKHLRVGEYREGLVLSETKEGLLVDIGVDHPALLRERLFVAGDRLTLQIIKVGERIEVQTVNREDIPFYWGFRVSTVKHGFGKLATNSNFDLVIATAKIGDSFTDLIGRISEKWSDAENILLGFGAPAHGLHDIVKEENLKLEDTVNFVVNTIPKQGTLTVRTEEALLASLAIINLYFCY